MRNIRNRIFFSLTNKTKKFRSLQTDKAFWVVCYKRRIMSKFLKLFTPLTMSEITSFAEPAILFIVKNFTLFSSKIDA